MNFSISGDRLIKRLAIAAIAGLGLQFPMIDTPLSSMLVGTAWAQSDPCGSEDPLNFDEELRSDCGGGEPYLPEHWGSDVSKPDESTGLPASPAGDPDLPTSLTAWFQDLSPADQRQFLQWASTQGLEGPNGQPLTIQQFNVLIPLIEDEMDQEGLSVAEKQSFIRMVTTEAGLHSGLSSDAGLQDRQDTENSLTDPSGFGSETEDFGTPSWTEDYGSPSYDDEPRSDLDYGTN